MGDVDGFVVVGTFDGFMVGDVDGLMAAGVVGSAAVGVASAAGLPVGGVVIDAGRTVGDTVGV